MLSLRYNVVAYILVLTALLVAFFVYSAQTASAQGFEQINYQGKLTLPSGVAVPDGTYNMRFWIIASGTAATGTAEWTEELTGSERVQVTNGLFSVMLGSTSPLTTVPFDMPLWLGVEIGGTGGSPTWDGEMSPRKVIGMVPAAFFALRSGEATVARSADALDGIASSSFLRSDVEDTMEAATTSPVLTVIQNGAGKIASFFSGVTEIFSILSDGSVGVGTSTPSAKFAVEGNMAITGTTTLATTTASRLTLSTALAATSGGTGLSTITQNQLLIGGAGNTWTQIATSSLGLGNGTFLGLTDTPSSYTANRVLFTNSGGTAVTDSANFTFTGSLLSVNGSVSSGYFTATSSLATSTFAGAVGIGTTSSQFPLEVGRNSSNQSALIHGSVVIGKNSAVVPSTNANIPLKVAGEFDQLSEFTAVDSTYGSAIRLMQGVAGVGSQWRVLGVTQDVELSTGVGHLALLPVAGKNVGIGTSSPWAKLSVQNTYGATNALFDIATTTSAANATSSLFRVLASGNVGVGTSSPAAKLGVNGLALADNFRAVSTTATSTFLGPVGFGTSSPVSGFTVASNNAIFQNTSNGTSFRVNDSNGSYILAVDTSGSLVSVGGGLSVSGQVSGDTASFTNNVGIGSSTPSHKLTVVGNTYIGGNLRLTGALLDSTAATGTLGMVLQTTGTSTRWVATSTLGISAGASTFLALTDTPSSYTANRVLFTNSGATAVTDSANFVFTGTNLGLGTTTPGSTLTVGGNAIVAGNATTTGNQYADKLIVGGYGVGTGYALNVDGMAKFGGDTYASGGYFGETSANPGAVWDLLRLGNYGDTDGTGAALVFNSYSSGFGELRTHSRISSYMTDATNGSVDGALVFETAVNNTTSERMRINGQNVGIGSSTPSHKLTVVGNTYIGGNLRLTGALLDSTAATGTLGMVLQSTGTSTRWVATSTLGISSGATTFLALTDTPSSYTANRVLFTNSGGTAVTDSANFTFTGSLLSVNGSVSSGYFTATSSLATSTFAGAVGIGTTSSRYPLEVGRNGSNQSALIHGSVVIGKNSAIAPSTNANIPLKVAGEFSQLSEFISSDSSNDSTIRLMQGEAGVGSVWRVLGGTQDVELTTGIGHLSLMPVAGKNVAIGTSSPWAKLSVQNTYGATNALFDIATTTSAANATSSLFRVLASGNVGVGTTSPAAKLGVSGLALADNFRAASSTADSLFNGTVTIGSGSGLTSKLKVFGNGTNTPAEFETSQAGVATVLTLSNSNGGGNAASLDFDVTGTTRARIYSYDSTLLFETSQANSMYFNINGAGNTAMVIDTTLNVGIGSSTPSHKLTVVGNTYMGGNLRLTGALLDSTAATGTLGMVLQSTGTSTRWVATSTLGISSGATTFLALTDTPSSYTANRVLFTNSGATAVTDSANFVFTGTNLGLGTTTPGSRLTVVGAAGSANPFLIASSTGATLVSVSTDGDLATAGDIYSPGYIESDAGFTVTGGNAYRFGSTGSARISGSGYNAGGDYVQIQTANTARLHIDNSGNVGIGSTSPAALLGVNGLALADYFRAASTTATSSFAGNAVFSNAAAHFGFGTTTPVSQFTINGNRPTSTVTGYIDPQAGVFTVANNNVEIFTAGANAYNQPMIYMPAQLLTENIVGINYGSLALTPGSSGAAVVMTDSNGAAPNAVFMATGEISFGTTTITTASTFIQSKAGLNPFAVASSSGSSLLTLTQAGNLGIGTTSPAARLGVNGLALADYFRAASTTATSTFMGAVGIGTSTANSRLTVVGAAGTASPFIVASSTGAAMLTVRSSGNVGIGTSTPTQALSVVGNALFRNTADSPTAFEVQKANGDYILSLDTSTTQTLLGGALFAAGGIYGINGDQGNPSFSFTNDTDTGIFGSGGSNYIGFTTAGTEAMRVNSSGALLIGTVTQSGEALVATGYSNSLPAAYIENTHNDGAGLFIDVASGGTNSNQYLLDVAKGGTSRFSVLHGGNVGIASSTPSHKLTVAGNTYIGGNLRLTGALLDSTAATGTLGMVLQSTGTSTRWVATSTLGITGGASTFLSLTDTPSSYTANRIMYTNSGATALTDSANLVFTGTRLGIGSTTPTAVLTVAGATGSTELFAVASTTASDYFLSVNPYGETVIGPNFQGNATMYLNTDDTTYAMIRNFSGSGNTTFASDGSLTIDIDSDANDTGNNFTVQANGATTLFTALDTGNVGIGTSTPAAKLGVDGLVLATHFRGASTTATSTFAGALGIGTSTPFARSLTIDRSSINGTTTAGIGQYLAFANSSAGAQQFGNSTYIRTTNTATTTLVGSILRIEDSTTYGNTLRGFEVQTERGTNTQGENTAISGFARTFGVRGVTEGDAGGTYEPAGVYGETRGTTQGNAIRGYSSTITTAALLKLFQDTSTFTGTGLLMNFGNSGGSFSSTTASKFIDLQNAGTSRFTVGAYGALTIGDGTTNNNAGIQIGYGGLCVDNDGSCNASTTGRISSVSTATGNSDLAEMYFSNDSLLPGEVVYLKGGLSVGRASQSTKDLVIGVVSTLPGLIMGENDASLRAGEEGHPIALKGRVPVRVSNENGEVKKGDELMLSSVPGVVMKASSTGTVVGIALEDYEETRAYSDTFINQFGESIIVPDYTPINRVSDPRIDDGCYYGGGSEAGEAPCVPLRATTTAAQYDEADAIALAEAKERALRALARESSERVTAESGEEVRVGQIIMFVDLRYRYLDAGGEAMVAALGAQIGTDATDTVWSRLVTLASNFVDGVLSVFTLKADRVETNELCVDGVCVTADDLRTMLEGTPQTPEDPAVTEGEGDSTLDVTDGDSSTEETSTSTESGVEVIGSEVMIPDEVDQQTEEQGSVSTPEVTADEGVTEGTAVTEELSTELVTEEVIEEPAP